MYVTQVACVGEVDNRFIAEYEESEPEDDEYTDGMNLNSSKCSYSKYLLN